MGALVKDIIENSIAEEVEIEAGDILLSINERPIYDILDYRFYSQDDFLVIDIEKADKEVWSIEIEKDYDEELGIILDGAVFDKMKVCRNRCIFCFIDQLPPKMRRTLYIKDDDYRYSFLYGNFISLTNLNDDDWQKIIDMRLSPLYVSVHCMNPEIRAKMFANPEARHIKRDLERLKNAGIEVHTQIVLCPGINDGLILEESINELAEYYPAVFSVGIVPVGLTGYRSKLQELSVFSPDEAEGIIDFIDELQKKFRRQFNRGFVYLADEFYVKAEKDFPQDGYYDDYCQIENGIGLARIFLDDFAAMESSLPSEVDSKQAYIVTGESAIAVLEGIVARLNKISGLLVNLLPVKNNFFGGNVSVTGLLTGSDIIKTLGKKYAGKKVIVPEIVFKEGQDILLDNISIRDIESISGARIITVDGSAESLIQAILD